MFYRYNMGKPTLNRLHLIKEIILDSLDTSGIYIAHSAYFIDHFWQLLEDQFPRCIREAFTEGDQVVATTVANINEEWLLSAEIWVVEDPFADGEPVGPEGAARWPSMKLLKRSKAAGFWHSQVKLSVLMLFVYCRGANNGSSGLR